MPHVGRRMGHFLVTRSQLTFWLPGGGFSSVLRSGEHNTKLSAHLSWTKNSFTIYSKFNFQKLALWNLWISSSSMRPTCLHCILWTAAFQYSKHTNVADPLVVHKVSQLRQLRLQAFQASAQSALSEAYCLIESPLFGAMFCSEVTVVYAFGLGRRQEHSIFHIMRCLVGTLCQVCLYQQSQLQQLSSLTLAQHLSLCQQQVSCSHTIPQNGSAWKKPEVLQCSKAKVVGDA